MSIYTLSLVLLVVLLGSTALFFFFATRGALILRSIRASHLGRAGHVYPVYSDMHLIKLVDFQPIISAILLFQYDRLVSNIVAEIAAMDLRGKRVLITSCAFGNVIPRVVEASLKAGAERVVIIDIVKNELSHARSKLGKYLDRVDFLEEDALAMQHADGSFAVNVIFFLLHELPNDVKGRALDEAERVLAPDGKLLLAEFHRPSLRVLRTLSWIYFKTFEPWGLALWDVLDPMLHLGADGRWQCKRSTYLFENFQVIAATRPRD